VLRRTFAPRPDLESAILVKKARNPESFAKADDCYPLALALLRIQFNAMNLTIRPRAAVYGFILTGSKFAIGRPPFFLTLIDSL
jgi:hypothetical protein